MFATAKDILSTPKYRKSFVIDGLDKPVEIVGLTQAGVMALSELNKHHGDSPAQINVWLIKQCVPAFKWWSLAKINKKLPIPVILDLVKEIVAHSGIGDTAVEDAEKKSVNNLSSDSSSN